MYDPSFKEDALPLFDPSLPTPEEEKQKTEDKESDSMIDYYPPSPVYTMSYEEDDPIIVNNLVLRSDPIDIEQTNIKTS